MALGSKKKIKIVTNTQTQNAALSDISGLGIGGNQGPVAVSLSTATTETDQGAVRGAFGFGGQALDTVRDVSADALELSAQAVRSIDDTSRAQLAEALDFANRASVQALDFAAASTRSDAALNTETLIKWGGGALALLALAFLFK